MFLVQVLREALLRLDGRELKRLTFGVNYDRRGPTEVVNLLGMSISQWVGRILSWDINADRRAILKVLFRDWRFELICLQKTKLEEASLSVARSS